MAAAAAIRMGGEETFIRDLQRDRGHELVTALLHEAGFVGVFNLFVAEAERGNSHTKGVTIGIPRGNYLEVHVQPGDNGSRKKCRLTPPHGVSVEAFRQALSDAKDRISARTRKREDRSSDSSPPGSPARIAVSEYPDATAATATRSWDGVRQFLGDTKALDDFLVEMADRFDGRPAAKAEMSNFVTSFTKFGSKQIAPIFRFLTARNLLKKKDDGYVVENEAIGRLATAISREGKVPKIKHVAKAGKVRRTAHKASGVTGVITRLDVLIGIRSKIEEIEQGVAAANKDIVEIQKREKTALATLKAIRGELQQTKSRRNVLIAQEKRILDEFNLTSRTLRFVGNKKKKK